ncbi:hypothetical protein M2263_001129 [Providencia alcalifaciens]|nr:hypothetical protein [Providencia alcalifaciens]
MLARFSPPIAITDLSLSWMVKFPFKTAIQGKTQYYLKQNKSQHGLDSDHREVTPYVAYNRHNFIVSYLADQFIKGLNMTFVRKKIFIRQYVYFGGSLTKIEPLFQCELSMTTN